MYEDSDRPNVIRELATQAGGRFRVANGFWINTLDRLFALKSVIREVRPETQIVHLESDVLSFVDQEVVAFMKENFSKLAVPALSREQGCGSLIYAKSTHVLATGLLGLEQILQKEGTFITDMDLLGRGLSTGILDELPSRPNTASSEARNSQNLINPRPQILFDAAAIGMYLFGADSLHTGGSIVSGYLHPDFEFDLTAWNWKLERNLQGVPPLTGVEAFTSAGVEVRFANLHVHSKIDPGTTEENSDNWKRIIQEANGSVVREIVSVRPTYDFQPLSRSERLKIFFAPGAKNRWQSVSRFIQSRFR